MDSLRKWFYRPKKDDKSLLAQFFYADEGLNIIASELDSFDGRKDPERCTFLVNQLRQSQDKVLTITNSIMDVLIGDERANRDFRVKFPEDVLQENLAGQLWFGAECLAAGSSIMNREAESTAMRPLAKALTKSLENVRNLLREACLRNNTPNGPLKLNNNELVTEMLLESLKIFDRLFAEFELCYVSAMVPVKTTQEYELQELIGVLFSETLQRALKMKLLIQETVDDCDPALMFTIPRLAIVSGLVVFPSGPLCIDRPVEEMSEMFRPFRTLLLKIRELLWTLNKRELYTLEKLLCDNEQSGDVKFTDCHISDEFVSQFYKDYSLCKDLTSGFITVSTSDNEECNAETVVEAVEAKPELTKSDNVEIPSTSGYLITNTVEHDTIVASIPNKREVIVKVESLPDHDSLQVICDAAATLSSILNTKETDVSDEKGRKIDIKSPNDSGICTENTSLDRSPSLELNDCQCNVTVGHSCRCLQKRQQGSTRRHSPSTSKTPRKSSRRLFKTDESLNKEEDTSSMGSTDTTSSFSSACADDEEIAMALQAAEVANRNEVRAKFRSSEDLIHRLYVCIAGVADQLQTNFASDLRNILKSVFLMNASDSIPQLPDPAVMQTSIEYSPSENEVIENEFSVDPNILAQEALFDSNVYFHLSTEENEAPDYTNHPRQNTNVENSLSADLSRYASLREEVSHLQTGPSLGTSARDVERPPIWIPDVEAPKCMSCGQNFTVVKRRHHCRNCGKVFCARCSSNSVPLPKYGHVKPVRVCNKCFMYHLAPFTM